MEIIQECAARFKRLAESTTYVFHTSLNKKISVFSIDFKISDFHHAIGLQYLNDVTIPKNTKKTLDWVLDKKKPVTDKYLAMDSNYKEFIGLSDY